MMRRTANALRDFAAGKRATAAIEFAILAPVLLVLLLATFDAGRAIAIYMKVRAATYALSAITNQYTTIHDTDMQQILGATSVVLCPYASSPVSVVVSQLRINNSGHAKVSWSDTLNGTARTVNSTVTIPSGLANPNTYLVLGEVSYSYAPLFGYFTHGAIMLSDNLYVAPRSSASITRSSP